MATSKKAFGQFVTTKRQASGLTQRELADRLFITESAVSKWERGLSYPDISLVTSLAAQLGVSEGELINASEDPVIQRVEREARFYNRWKRSILWGTTIAYALALATCFIVNLAVDHTLSWFWVVLTAVAVAFTLTTLPLLPRRPGAWRVLGAFVVALFTLFTVTWSMNGRGPWLPIAITAVVFAAIVILGPLALRSLHVPEPYSHHRTLIALVADTIALVALVFVSQLAIGELGKWWTQSVPILGLALVFPWFAVLVARYLPVRGLFRAALVVAALGAYDFFVFGLLVSRLADDRSPRLIDLGQWHGDYINGNVSLLVMLGCLVVAAALAVTASLHVRTPKLAA